MQPFDLLGDREATLMGLGFPVAQEARVYSPGTVLGFPVKETRTAPYGSFMRGLGRAGGIVMDGLGDACPGSWTDPFLSCDCPSGTFTYADKSGNFSCASDVPRNADGSPDFSTIKQIGNILIPFGCQMGVSWLCPKVSAGGGGVPVVTPPPWYATTGGMLGILGGAVALGVGAYLVVRK